MKIHKLIFIVFIIVIGTNNLRAQGGKAYVNLEWTDTTGSPVFNPILNVFGIEWSKSIIAVNGDMITVGHTYAGTAGEDIYIVRHTDVGSIVFEQNYDVGSAHYNDYGTDIYEAGNGDLLIVGTTANGGSTNYDVVVLRVSSSGVLISSATKDGPASKNDVAVSVKEDGMGNVLVAANREDSYGFYDYWLLRFDAGLNFNTDGIYDYTGLTDIVIGINYSIGGAIELVGASVSGTNSCDYAIASFDESTLSYLGDARSSLPGVALDKALAYVRDAGNNTFITGQAWNGTNYDLKTVKIAANMTVAWTATLDVHGRDDAGTTIAIDPVSGDIFVAGYATQTSNLKEMLIRRYDASTGATVNIQPSFAVNSTNNSFIEKICTNTNGDVYFIGGETNQSNLKEVVVGKIKNNGRRVWQKTINDANLDVLPSDIEMSGNAVNVISILTSTLSSYQATQYTDLEMDTSRYFGTNGKAVRMKNQLIVRFKGAAMDTAAIDNIIGTKISEFGKLSDFITTTANSQLTLALGAICRDCAIKAVKVFPYLTSTYTSTTSRLGETVPLDDFWTTLLLEFPSTADLQQVNNAFNANHSIITYAHPNFLGELATSDTYWGYEYSLYNSADGISAEAAWNIANGKPSVRIGIFDTGINYNHDDLISIVKDGWDFFYDIPLFATTLPDDVGHGTSVAGIIGAGRDNSQGVAGIASGCSLYSLAIIDKFNFQVSTTFISNAIMISCFGDANIAPYTYSLNLMNHSWRFDNGDYNFWYTDSNIVLLNEMVHKANRLGVTFVAARGNEGVNNDAYPANCDDDWVLTVGGTGTDGNYATTANSGYKASYGAMIDVAAPSAGTRIYSTGVDLNDITNNHYYTSFSETSAAAPHVTGVVGLMMSYINDTLHPENNLAPEDCEFIVQKSATDVGAAGYDSLTGYGRLNAYSALHMIEKPYNTLRHFGTDAFSPYTISKSVYSNSDTIRLTDPYMNYESSRISFNRGKYNKPGLCF